jgi:hypothetical protein
MPMTGWKPTGSICSFMSSSLITPGRWIYLCLPSACQVASGWHRVAMDTQGLPILMKLLEVLFGHDISATMHSALHGHGPATARVIWCKALTALMPRRYFDGMVMTVGTVSMIQLFSLFPVHATHAKIQRQLQLQGTFARTMTGICMRVS